MTVNGSNAFQLRSNDDICDLQDVNEDQLGSSCNDPKNELVKIEPNVCAFVFVMRFDVVVCCPELWLRGLGFQRQGQRAQKLAIATNDRRPYLNGPNLDAPKKNHFYVLQANKDKIVNSDESTALVEGFRGPTSRYDSPRTTLGVLEGDPKSNPTRPLET
uniref:Uncharacterized protein n=1 Tax=Solanum tuberosum TaxID=4113 RepID=M1DEM0_SOLTU